MHTLHIILLHSLIAIEIQTNLTCKPHELEFIEYFLKSLAYPVLCSNNFTIKILAQCFIIITCKFKGSLSLKIKCAHS